MGKMIGGVYIPSYSEILKDTYETKRLMDKEKAANAAAAEEKTYQRDRQAKADERAAAESASKLKRDKAYIDYQKALTMKAKLKEEAKDKPDAKEKTEQLEFAAKLIASGMLKQAEEYMRETNLIPEDGTVTQGEGDNITIVMENGAVDLTPEGLAVWMGVKNKEEMKKFTEPKDQVTEIVAKIIDSRSKDIEDLGKEIKGMEKDAANNQGDFAESSLDIVNYQSKRMREIEQKHLNQLKLSVSEKAKYGEDIKKYAETIYKSYTKPAVAGESGGGSGVPGAANAQPKTPQKFVVKTPGSKKDPAAKPTTSLDSYMSITGD